MKNLEWMLVGILLAIMVLPQTVKAQSDNIEVELSEPFKVVNAKSKIYLSNDKYVVAFKYSDPDEINIQAFNSSNLSEGSRSVYDEIDRKASIEYFGVLDNRFYMFYTSYDKKAETENLFSLEIDPKTSQVIGGEKKVLTVKGKLSGNVKKKGMYGLGSVKNDRFKFDFSRDDKFMMIYYIYSPEVKADDKSYDRLGIHVFDFDLIEQWNTTSVMKYTEAQMSFRDFEVDTFGDAYVLYNVLSKDGVKGRYEVLKYTADRPEGESWDIRLKKYGDIESLSFYEKNNDEFVIGGVYEEENGFPGVFVISVDKDDDGIDQNYIPIPENVLNAHNTVKENKKKVKAEKKGKDYNTAANFSMDNLRYYDDGSCVIIGEEYWVTSSTRTTTNSSGGTSTKTTYTYNYGDIIATKLDEEGELMWSVKLAKLQRGGRPGGGMSYESISNSESLYFLYLDHEENLNLPEIEAPTVHVDGKGGYMTAARVDMQSGKITKTHLFNMREVNGVEVFQFSTNRIVEIDDDDIAVELYKKKKEDVWVRVRLK